MKFIHAIVAAALLLPACSNDDEADKASGATAQTPGAGAAQTPGPGGPGGPGRGRGPVTIAATDITPVRKGLIEDAVAITGNLQPLERIEIRARIEGEVLNVLVREGDVVRTGQVLARFESMEQESGAESAEADVAAARTELSTATWNLDQTRELFKEGAVPERDVKAGEQAVASARARLAAAESRRRTSSTTLQDTRVLAPNNGVIERRLVANGEHVNRGASLFTLVRTEMLELTGNVSAREANRIMGNQLVRFNADGRSFTGRVARVAPTIDAASRSVAVYVQIPNQNGSLKGGTFASGRIVSRAVPDALIVPTSAVRQEAGTGGSYVYAINGDMVERTPVTIGIVDEGAGLVQIASGVNEGDRVVSGVVNIVARSSKVTIIGGESGQRGGGAPQQQTRPQPVPRN